MLIKNIKCRERIKDYHYLPWNSYPKLGGIIGPNILTDGLEFIY